MIDPDQLSNTNEGAQDVAFLKIYLGDASLEVPNAPTIFNREWEPDVDVEIQNAVEPLDDGMHQVQLLLTVTAHLNEEVAYLAEVQQCGIFSISGYDEGIQHAILGSYCPTVLFPFAREAIADLVQRAGFPQLLLQPVDFETLYRQHMEQNQADGEKALETRH
jgi:preprotein translocase subunit SecB